MAFDHDKDDDWIRDYQGGDNNGFVELYRKYCVYTCKSLQRKGVLPADAEDGAQEIWRRMLNVLKNLPLEKPFIVYLNGAIRKQFLDHIRKKKNDHLRKTMRLFDERPENGDKGFSLVEMIAAAKRNEPDQEAIYQDLLRVLKYCLEKMRNKLYRAAVELHLEGFKIKQVAELLHIEFSHANVSIVRGTAELRPCVEANYGRI